MAEKATHPDEGVIYADLTEEQYAKAMELLSMRTISYEYDADDRTWFKLSAPVQPEDVAKVEAALES